MTGGPGRFPGILGAQMPLAPPRKRRVFFSFHYARDSWSVAQIRNSWVANPLHGAQPYLDKAQWEAIRRQGDASIRRWIDGQMNGTSVTVVLIGPETLHRRWVRYEIDRSQREGKGLLGVTMEGIRQSNGHSDSWNRYAAYGPFIAPNNTAPIYSWIGDGGRANLGRWIEEAARRVGR